MFSLLDLAAYVQIMDLERSKPHYGRVIRFRTTWRSRRDLP